MPSRLDDPAQKVFFADEKWLVVERRYVRVEGGRAGFEIDEDAILMVMSVRNAGAGDRGPPRLALHSRAAHWAPTRTRPDLE